MAEVNVGNNFRENGINLRSKMTGYERKNDPLCSKFLIIRCDMKNSKRATSKLRKPFDDDFTNAMKSTLVKWHDIHRPTLSYTQSDEISFIFFDAANLYNLRREKITSLVAAQVSVYFNHFMKTQFEIFDCRVFNVPTKEDCFEYLLWRNYYDGQNYSIGRVARQFFSLEELHKKNALDVVGMIREKTDISQYSAESFNGVFMKTLTVDNKRTLHPDYTGEVVCTYKSVTKSDSFLMKSDYSNEFFNDFF